MDSILLKLLLDGGNGAQEPRALGTDSRNMGGSGGVHDDIGV